MEATADGVLACRIDGRITHDNLTGLPNKALITDILKMSIQSASNKDYQVGVFLVDIDHFTQINDVFGRSKADEMLKRISRRLQEGLEKRGVLCRIGGDEFIIIANLHQTDDAKQIAQQVFESLMPPFNFYDTVLNITCTIGITVAPKDGDSPEELLRYADIAMVRGKKQGCNSYIFYSPPLDTYTLAQMQLENELHTAIKQQQFTIFYQPIVDLQTMQYSGVEALLRWQHPKHGLLSPDSFLKTAEDLGLMVDIGAWVLKTGCEQMVHWQQDGLDNIQLAVNVSALQFKNQQLVHDVTKALDSSKMSAQLLELELTKQTLIEHSKDVFESLQHLRSLGIKVSLDDFGTGFSSLNYIKNFPLDNIKIDQTFTRDIIDSPESQQLVMAIINMTSGLHLQAVAEGIEHEEQLDFLHKLDCRYGQGYYFAKPMPANACFKFLQNSIKKPRLGCRP